MKKINVLLADDSPVFRQGLKALLEAEAEIVVAGEADNGQAKVELARQLLPEVVIMVVPSPGLSALETARQISNGGSGTRVLVLFDNGDDDYLHQLAEAGATGYRLKQTTAADLIKGVRQGQGENAFFSPAISKRLTRKFPAACWQGRPVRRLMAMLTARELEVWQLIAEGLATKQIAYDLFISNKTVEKHRQHLMAKLNIHHVAGLTRHAIAEGIIKAVPDGEPRMISGGAGERHLGFGTKYA